MRQIILDTETTGLTVKDGHRIIEVAAVELINRKLTGNHYHQYICPMRAIDAGATQIHGITAEFLADKPLFQQISEPLLSFIKGSELIIHNAPFDTGFLNYEFQKIDVNFSIEQHCAVIDTLALARKKHPGVPNNLDALCKRYGVDNSQRELHGALLDCHLLAKVYLAMTGGQSTLFAETIIATPETKSLQSNTKVSEIKVELDVVYANQDELMLHQQQLDKIGKASGGKVLWSELESV